MSTSPRSHGETAKSRIKSVFEYLKALNDHRNPAVRQVKEHPWHFWLDHLPDHPDIELQAVSPGKGKDTDENEELTIPSYLFRVRRPKLTLPPLPSAEIHDWLHAGWDDPESDARFHLSRNQVDRQGETVTVQFNDSPARPAAFAAWQQKREKWREAERPARHAMAVFEKLYALHGKLERESELFDLVVSDGLLSWQRPENSIYHPLLIQRVQLEFDSRVPEFRIIDADLGCELYTSLFQTMSDVDATMLAARREELENGGYHPLCVEASAFLRGLVNHISSQGAFLDKGRPDQGCDQPTVGRAPLLFLRLRTKGYGNAIEQVIKSIESRQDFCDALVNIVGCETVHQEDDSAPPSILRERDVLFGKEANQEQFRIAQQLNRHGSVLVQGPPGTGKSHTIANLIGHLLAHGQSVLVTSHTTKALRVLRDHVIENLRPLCVSVLESDLESREQLKQSVMRIAGRLSQSNEQELESQAGLLNRQRNELSDALERTREHLRKARADEYRDIVVAGTPFAPSEAARKVANGRGQNDWIPEPVALGEPLPLSPTEINELYATNASTFPEDDLTVKKAFPPQAFILQIDEFQGALQATKDKIDYKLWQNLGLLLGQEKEIRGVSQQLRDALAEFKRFNHWQRAAVDAGRDDTGNRRPWDAILRAIDKCRKMVAEGQSDLIKHLPEIANKSMLKEQFNIATEIREHLKEGGELTERRMFLGRAIRKPWQTAYSGWSVNGRPPETADEMNAIRRLLAIEFTRVELGRLWDGLMTANGAQAFADFHGEPERSAAQFIPAITESLNWSALSDKA